MDCTVDEFEKLCQLYRHVLSEAVADLMINNLIEKVTKEV